MTKQKTVLMCLIFALTALLPTGTVISALFEYSFELVSVSGFAVATAVLSAFTVLIDLAFDTELESKTVRVLLTLNTPLSLIGAAFYLFKSFSPWVVIGVSVSVICCFILTVRHGKPYTLKVRALTLSVLTVFPVAVVSFFAYAFSDFGVTTVVKTVESPNGEYYAEVLDNDQGALGGATTVWVYERRGIDLLLFKISKKPQRVYLGRCGEADSMSIRWKDDGCLVINSVEYEIGS